MSHSYKRITNSSIQRAHITHNYVYWDGLFSDEELDKIIEICKQVNLVEGTTLGENKNEGYRISKNNFHHRNENTNWIFERLNSLIEHVNAEYFNYDLNGYEYYQYSEYLDTDSGHYNWHIDLAQAGTNLVGDSGIIETRKLSMTLLLNEPDVDFKGGEFSFKYTDDEEIPECKRGRAFFFPSYALHKVSPVTEGIRKSLVVWVTGPKFR